MTQDYTLIIDDDSLVKRAQAAGMNAVLLPEPDAMTTGITGLKMVLSDNEPAQIALALVEQGFEATEIEWLDGKDIDGGIASLIDCGIEAIFPETRDLHFDEIRSLADATEDPANMERIAAGPDWAERNIIWRRREVVVCAGPYGCGKSTFIQYLGVHWCLGEGAKYEDGHEKAGQLRPKPVWFCTWEDDPIEQRDQLERYCNHGLGTDWAEKLKRMILYTRPELDRERRLDWYVERALYMNKKFGTNFFVLDPWSEFDHEREKHETETEYVKKIMKVLGKLSVELNSIFVVVTHITKSKYSDDGTIRPFRVSDSFGSVQFGSTAARGFCVQRVSGLVGHQDHMIVYFDKVKIERTMGKARECVALTYDPERHELYQDLDATTQAAEAWGCTTGGINGGKRPKKARKGATGGGDPITINPGGNLNSSAESMTI